MQYYSSGTFERIDVTLTNWKDFENKHITVLIAYLEYNKINANNEILNCINPKYKTIIINYLNLEDHLEKSRYTMDLKSQNIIVGDDLFTISQNVATNSVVNSTGKYLFIGDSITYQQYFKFWKNYSNSATCAVGAGQGTSILKYLQSNCTLENKDICGINPNTGNPICLGSNKNFTKFSDYDTAVILFGVNDLASGYSSTVVINRYNDIINFLRSNGINNIVVLTTLPTLNTSTNKPYWQSNIGSRLNETNAALKTIQNITVLDSFTLFYNGSTGNPKYYGDSVHPNATGQQILSQLLNNNLN